MHIPKKYFQDRFVLFLLSVNVFLTLFGALLILIRFNGGRSGGYFVRYLPSLGLDAYKPGSSLQILSFILFSGLVLVFHTLLSIKIYPVRRHLATTVLGLGLLLLVVAIIVSNALLELR